MLKYIVVFYIICFCDLATSDPRKTGSYFEIIFSQQFAITTFFYEYLPYIDTDSNEYKTYLVDHRTIFEEQKWVVQGLWTLDSNFNLITACVNSEENEPALNSSFLDDNFQKQLKPKWPSLADDLTEMGIWEIDYRQFGICITEDVASYFRRGIELYEKYDIEKILKNARINPGNEYHSYRIADAVSYAIRKRVNVKCFYEKETQKQYLIEIEFCFNKKDDLIDCQIETYNKNLINACKANQMVIYPSVPKGYL